MKRTLLPREGAGFGSQMLWKNRPVADSHLRCRKWDAAPASAPNTTYRVD